MTDFTATGLCPNSTKDELKLLRGTKTTNLDIDNISKLLKIFTQFHNGVGFQRNLPYL